MPTLIQVFSLNLLYTIIGLGVGLLGAFLAFHLFDKLSPFSVADQLRQANLAVGVVVGSMFIMIGLLVGLIVGLGLN